MLSNSTLSARRQNAVPRGVAVATALHADHAENAALWDVEGRRYIDFAGGIAVLNVGHRHPRVIAAVDRQLARYTHTAFQVVPYEPYITLAERLNRLAPIDGPVKTALFTTGAEAAENAVKIARAATGRPYVIAFVNGFHGRSLFTAALTGKVAPYKQPFGVMPGQVYHAPFPSAENGVSDRDALTAIEHIFQADAAPEQVAAIIIEPVQGEGGFHAASPAFLASLRALCDEHGIVLIADEVQSGFGRTGKLFAIEHSGIRPDLLCMAKSLGGGFPISGVSGRAELMDAPIAGALGGTYAGSPVACAAALAVLDIIEEEHLLARSERVGERIHDHIANLAGRNDMLPITGLRSLGAMVAFDIHDDPSQASPGTSARETCRRAEEEGLILLSCGPKGETIRILVPLTVSDEDLDEGLTRLDQALRR